MKSETKKDARALDHNTLQYIRQKATKAVSDGVPVKLVAKMFDVSQKAVYEWMAKLASGGQTALLAKPVPGAPTILSGDQMQWIANAVKSKTPHQLQFDVWLVDTNNHSGVDSAPVWYQAEQGHREKRNEEAGILVLKGPGSNIIY